VYSVDVYFVHNLQGR